MKVLKVTEYSCSESDSQKTDQESRKAAILKPYPRVDKRQYFVAFALKKRWGQCKHNREHSEADNNAWKFG